MPKSAVSSPSTPAAASPDAVELPAPPGWRKLFIPNKSSSPGGIVFISPDGDEIKNKMPLARYLKAHHPELHPSDFDWGTGESPRRSLRIMERASPSKVSHSLRITENASPRKTRRIDKSPAKHSRKVEATEMSEDESDILEMMGFSDEVMVSTEDTGSKEGSPLHDTIEKGDARSQKEGISLLEDAKHEIVVKEEPFEDDGPIGVEQKSTEEVEQKVAKLTNEELASGLALFRIIKGCKREGTSAGNEAVKKSPEVKHKLEELKSPGTNIVTGAKNDKNTVNEGFNKTEENMKNEAAEGLNEMEKDTAEDQDLRIASSEGDDLVESNRRNSANEQPEASKSYSSESPQRSPKPKDAKS